MSLVRQQHHRLTPVVSGVIAGRSFDMLSNTMKGYERPALFIGNAAHPTLGQAKIRRRKLHRATSDAARGLCAKLSATCTKRGLQNHTAESEM